MNIASLVCAVLDLASLEIPDCLQGTAPASEQEIELMDVTEQDRHHISSRQSMKMKRAAFVQQFLPPSHMLLGLQR